MGRVVICVCKTYAEESMHARGIHSLIEILAVRCVNSRADVLNKQREKLRPNILSVTVTFLHY